jgi:NAD(P)-dependent dehydrogenase (short-subunit alcohol dehydrogenase family)
MADRLKGKVAFITGAGAGMGREASVLFAEEGARVVVADIDGKAAAETVRLVEKAGGQALAVTGDVAIEADVRGMIEQGVGRFGALHVLYNNAGVDAAGGVLEGTEADWDRCLDVNAKGTFLGSKFAAPEIEAAGGGSIINQGSVAALVGVREFAAYCAAKGAVVSLTRAMAMDLAPRSIRVNCVCPGTVFTPLMEPMVRKRGGGDLQKGLELTIQKYPVGRLGTPEDVARVALFLASDDAAFVTGAVYTVDGGMTAQ